MKLKKLLAVILVVSMVASVFTACGTKPTKTDDKPSTTGTPTSGTKEPDKSAYPGTPEANAITVNIAQEPPQLFSVTSTDTTSFTVNRHVLENLVELDANNQVIPGVAKDWTVSDDGLTYTFNLRDDMKWSNGEKVTANDFVFAWKSLLTPSFASDYAYFGYIFKNGQAFNEGKAKEADLGFKAVSDTKLEITLEYSAPYFLSTLAFGVFAPVNEKAYNQFGEAYGTDADKMVYNGPFKITSWEHESKLVIEKNADYPDKDKIALDKITFVMINDSNAALNSFKAGEADVIGVTGDQVKLLKGENYPVQTYDDGACFYLEYNMTDKFLKNANLRKALTYAVDKQSFVDNIVKNSSKAATSFTPPAVSEGKFTQSAGQLVPVLDVEKAKEFYQKALQELGVDKVELTMICDDGDVAIKNAAFVQEQLKKNLGVTINVESMPFKSRLERMSNKDFSLVFAGWGPDYNDPMTFLDMFQTGNGNNHTSYSNADYDATLDKVRKELDPAKRTEYLLTLEKTLMTDLPIGPIYWRSRDYVLSGKIASGVVRTAFQDMNYREVKLAK